MTDEWVEYGVNGTAQPNDYSFVYLCEALRNRLPNKIISLYFIGPSSQRLSYGGVQVGDLINYSWNPYYGSYQVPYVPGLSAAELGPAAVDLQSTSAAGIQDLARRTVQDGYGVFSTYSLTDQNISGRLSLFTRELHGSDAIYLG